MSGIFIKRGSLDADMHTGRIPREDKGNNWGDAFTCPGMPKIVNKPPEAKRQAWDRFFHIALRRNHPCQHLDFGLVASRTVRRYISIVLSHTVIILYYHSPRKLIQGREGSGGSPRKFPEEVNF